MHTSPPWQDRELCVLYIQGVFSTMTYSPAAHTNKACLGLRKKKRFLYFWRTSWKLKDWTDMAWRSVHLPGLLFTADTLLLTFPCPPSQMVPNVTFCCGDSWGKSLTWFDNSGINVKRGIHVGGERTHSGGKTKRKQQHKNKKLSKFHSGTNVTAQSRAAEAPDDGPKALHLWRRPRWL